MPLSLDMFTKTGLRESLVAALVGVALSLTISGLPAPAAAPMSTAEAKKLIELCRADELLSLTENQKNLSAPTLLTIAEAHLELGQTRQAARLLGTLLAERPDDCEVLDLLALTLCDQNQPDEGLKMALRAAAVKRGDARALAIQGLARGLTSSKAPPPMKLSNQLPLVGASNDKTGMDLIEKAKHLSPHSLLIYDCAARLHFRKEDALAASSDLDDYLKLEPGSARGYMHQAQNFERACLTARAIEAYSKVLKLSPRSLQAHLRRGFAYSQMGESKKAGEDMEVILQYPPGSIPGHQTYLDSLAKIYERNNDCKKAIKARTIELSLLEKESLAGTVSGKRANSSNKDYKRLIAHCLERRGSNYVLLNMLKEARADFDRVLTIYPFEPLSLEQRALCLEKTGKYKEAIADWTSLLSHNTVAPGWYRRRAADYKKLGDEKAAQRDLSLAKQIETNR